MMQPRRRGTAFSPVSRLIDPVTGRRAPSYLQPPAPAPAVAEDTSPDPNDWVNGSNAPLIREYVGTQARGPVPDRQPERKAYLINESQPVQEDPLGRDRQALGSVDKDEALLKRLGAVLLR